MGKIEYLNVPGMVVALVILAFIAVFLNSLGLYIIRTTKTLWKRNSSLLLMNLLAVHLFQGVFVFPFYAGKKVKQDFVPAQVFANGFRLTHMLTFYGTCLGILVIAIDRFLATILLTKYKVLVTRRRVKIALVALWVYIVGLCLVPFIDVEGPNYGERFNPVTNETVIYEKPKFYVYQQQREWVLFMLIVNTALPYVLIIACYIFIGYRLRRMQVYHPAPLSNDKHSKNSVAMTTLGESHPHAGENVPLKKKDVDKYKQVTKLTLILTAIYGVFWTPSIFYYPLKEDCKNCFPDNYEDSELEQYLGFITKYLAFLDAAAAPLVYCFMHKEFQKSLERIKSKLLRQPLSEREDVITTTKETTSLM